MEVDELHREGIAVCSSAKPAYPDASNDLNLTSSSSVLLLHALLPPILLFLLYCLLPLLQVLTSTVTAC